MGRCISVALAFTAAAVLTAAVAANAQDAASSSFAEPRGFEVVPIKNASGRQVGLYKASYALVIGVSDYTAGWPKLQSVIDETKEIQSTLEANGFHVRRVLDPNEAELKGEFEQFIDQHGYDRDNRLLVFFSGHGYSRKGGAKGYLVPTDAPDPRQDEKGFLRKALPMGQILAWCHQMEAKHALFLFDSCFSGTIFKTKALPEVPPHISADTSLPVRQFITAGGAGEQVPARSVFARCFVRALRGEADLSKDGYVTGSELGMYLRERVMYYRTGQTPQYGKIRDVDLDRGDFVFVMTGAPSDPDGDDTDTPPPPPQPLPEALSRGLILHYDFDRDGGGHVADASGVHPRGIVSGADWQPMGKRGGCYLFNGRDDYIVCDHSDSLSFAGHVTMAMWVKPRRHTRGGALLINKWTNALEDKYINLDKNGKVDFFLFGAPNVTKSRTSLRIGKWHHIVCTYDGLQPRIYINGLLNIAGKKSGGAIKNAGGRLYIGRNFDRRTEKGHRGRPFDGWIDDVMIYDRVLSPTEVQQLYKAQKTGAPSDPDGIAPAETFLLSEADKLAEDAQGYGVTDKKRILHGVDAVRREAMAEQVKRKVIPEIKLDAGISSDEDYQAAAALIYARRYETAGEMLEEIHRKRPHSIQLLSALGYVSEKLGDDAGTVFYNRRIIALIIASGRRDAAAVEKQRKSEDVLHRLAPSTLLLLGFSASIKEQADKYSGRDRVRVLNAVTVLRTIAVGLASIPKDAIEFNGRYVRVPPYPDLTDGLVAYYPFNGNATDESENSNDGVVTGATLSTDRFGNADSAYRFDGNDHINLGNKPDFNFGESDFSFSLWIKSNGTQIKKYIIGKYNPVQKPAYGIGTGHGTAYAFIGDASRGGRDIETRGNTTLSDSLWHQMTVIFDRDANMTIYVDGELDTASDISSEQGNISNAINLYIGRVNDGRNFSGSIDDVRIYNRALSEAEIQELYNYTPPEPPVSDWVTILRSDDPQLWNTSQDSASGFALSHGDPRMPAEISYVRLARRDTGDAVIIPITRENLSKRVPVAGGYIWNGTAEHISRNLKGKTYESRLLGIGSEGMLRRYHDKGGIVTVGFDRKGERPSGHGGWGFGRSTVVYSNQAFVWNGNLISDKTAFEIAVKSGQLTAEEQAFLLK